MRAVSRIGIPRYGPVVTTTVVAFVRPLSVGKLSGWMMMTSLMFVLTD
jgi:hypothetical protein